jgi:transposase
MAGAICEHRKNNSSDGGPGGSAFCARADRCGARHDVLGTVAIGSAVEQRPASRAASERRAITARASVARAADMMRPDANVAVFVCVAPVDMRKQAATLALIVEQSLKRNIFEPALWVFSNERRDRIKIVYWQRNGLCLWSKRLEGRDRFIFPRHIEGETVTIRGEQLEELLAGFDLWRVGHRELLLRRVG